MRGCFQPFDAAFAAKQLRAVGATRVRGLNEQSRRNILTEFMDTTKHPLAAAETVVGPHDVPQNYYKVTRFPEDSIARSLMHECGAWLSNAFATLADNPLQKPVQFNDCDMHWYPRSDVGIGFHRDGIWYNHLIAVLMLAGDGQFMLAERRDDEPHTALRIIAVPGDIILLRASYFDGLWKADTQRFHGVFNIRHFRATLSFRQRNLTAPTA